jgi:hypothetical protein
MPTNHIRAALPCPRCGETREHEVGAMLDGQGAGHEDYRLGDRVDWLPGRERDEGGRPADGNLTTEGYVVCDVCNKDFFVVVNIRGDVLTAVEVDESRPGYDFS